MKETMTVKLETVRSTDCHGCFFNRGVNHGDDDVNRCLNIKCCAPQRKDGHSVIWVVKKIKHKE